MDRKIVIKDCDDCPHLDHMGAFGKVAYVPRCGKSGDTLPYTVGAPDGNPTAYSEPGIPDSCPLETD
ncbi:MAG: hypothetical protein KAJ73_00140 [Zetaproteobacteria bacterium]|nr:hypothetical protein [Zetaproteobacteria bacterium]